VFGSVAILSSYPWLKKKKSAVNTKVHQTTKNMERPRHACRAASLLRPAPVESPHGTYRRIVTPNITLLIKPVAMSAKKRVQRRVDVGPECEIRFCTPKSEPPSIPMKFAQIVSTAASRSWRGISASPENGRVDRHRFQRVDFFRNLHRANFRGNADRNARSPRWP